MDLSVLLQRICFVLLCALSYAVFSYWLDNSDNLDKSGIETNSGPAKILDFQLILMDLFKWLFNWL